MADKEMGMWKDSKLFSHINIQPSVQICIILALMTGRYIFIVVNDEITVCKSSPVINMT